MATKKYDATVARIAGNILSGVMDWPELQKIGRSGVWDNDLIKGVVACARAIVAETEWTEPKEG